MRTMSLLRLIRDEAGFHAPEATIAITLLALAAAVGVVTFGGGVAEFLDTAGENVKSTTILMPSFGVNPLTN